MAVMMHVSDWLDLLSSEYLRDYVKRGGAAVKFAVPQDRPTQELLMCELEKAAEANGYVFVALDASNTKIHMIDKVFHALAKQLDWDSLAYDFLSLTLLESNYLVPEAQSDFSLAEVARLNGLGIGEMRAAMNSRMTDRIFRDYAMTQEFRIAMLRLCQAQLDPGDVQPSIPDSVKDWLRGDLRLISALKSALIFQKIGRHNGRHMLFSLFRWLHIVGKAGMVLTLDISRLIEAKKPSQPDGTIYYSSPAVLDGYEVLRQFIDGTDELGFALILVVAPPSFLLPDERRGLHAYDALRLRIWDDVRDRERPNLLSSLIRLCKEAPGDLPGGPR